MCVTALDHITNPIPRANQPVIINSVSERAALAITVVDVKFKAERL